MVGEVMGRNAVTDGEQRGEDRCGGERMPTWFRGTRFRSAWWP